MTQIPDMNGDGFRELVVGAPLEDDHKGAVYVFYGQGKTIQHQYRQVPDKLINQFSQTEGIEAGNINNHWINFLSCCLSSVCLQLVSLQVCIILDKVFMVFWMLTQTGLLISQWEHWELLSSSGQTFARLL